MARIATRLDLQSTRETLALFPDAGHAQGIPVQVHPGAPVGIGSFSWMHAEDVSL